jgi:hypothetical protein
MLVAIHEEEVRKTSGGGKELISMWGAWSYCDALYCCLQVQSMAMILTLGLFRNQKAGLTRLSKVYFIFYFK